MHDQISDADFGTKIICRTELDFAGLKLHKNRCRFLINQFICANFCFLHAYCTLPTLADIKHREENKGEVINQKALRILCKDV